METGVGNRGEISYRVFKECIQWLLSKKLKEVSEARSCLGKRVPGRLGCMCKGPEAGKVRRVAETLKNVFQAE